MSIETTYRGHTIRWSDNADEWTCYDLSDKVRSSPKLSNIKKAIDRLYLNLRKELQVPCFEAGYHSQRDAEYVKSAVIEYLGFRVQRSWASNDEKIEHKVAVMAKRQGSDRPSRQEKKLEDIFPDTEEFHEKWVLFAEAHKKKLAAEKAASEAYAALPRLQLEDIQELVDLHNKENKDG